MMLSGGVDFLRDYNERGLYNRLYHSLLQRNYEKTKHLLKKGLSVNHVFRDGTVPLLLAAEVLDVETAELLLSLKASPDMKNAHGETALMIGLCEKEIARTLLNHGCDVNLTDSQQRTALHLAGAQGLTPTVKLLLEYCAKVNMRDKWGRTPLHAMLLNINHGQSQNANNYIQLSRMLISYGADVNCKDNHDYTPLYLAVNCRGYKIVKLLLAAGSRPDDISYHGFTPLALAVMKGYEAICHLLVSFNCNVNSINLETFQPCFETAIQQGHFVIAKLLYEAGCDIPSKRQFVNTVTLDHYACTKSNMLVWLKSILVSPASLAQLCRKKIRKCFRHDIQTKIYQLNYPKALKQYILLQ